MFISCVNFSCYCCCCITKATNKLLFPLCCMYWANTSVAVTVFELFVALKKTQKKNKFNKLLWWEGHLAHFHCNFTHLSVFTANIWASPHGSHERGKMFAGFLLENFVPTLFPHTLNNRGSWTCISMLFECPTLMLERLSVCLHCTTLLKE